MRATLPDGTTEVEVLAKLAMPLPLLVAGELMGAIGRAAEQLGYTDVNWIYAGPHAGCIAGIPPART